MLMAMPEAAGGLGIERSADAIGAFRQKNRRLLARVAGKLPAPKPASNTSEQTMPDGSILRHHTDKLIRNFKPADPAAVFMDTDYSRVIGFVEGEYPVLKVDGPVVLIGDTQGVRTHWPLAKVAADLGCALGAKWTVWGGDMWDMEALSNFDPSYPNPPTIKQEDEEMQKLANLFLSRGQSIFMIWGNHEARLNRSLRGQASQMNYFANVLKIGQEYAGRIEVNPYRMMELRTLHHSWLVNHPGNYSYNMSVEAKLAEKYQMNVIGFHNHVVGLGKDKYRRYQCWSVGACCRVKHLSYTGQTPNTMANMEAGVGILIPALNPGVDDTCISITPKTDLDELNHQYRDQLLDRLGRLLSWEMEKEYVQLTVESERPALAVYSGD